ncbi:MAG: allantoinase AllB [Streptosporangiaceae bacterium]
MTDFELVFRAQRVITPHGEAALNIGVTAGRIVAVTPGELTGRTVVELAADEVLLPGLVDTHVHVNEPGRTEWEGFASATRAAAAGGVTTIIDMPLNSIPATVDVAALNVKKKAALGQCHVDVGFWAGAIPGNVPELKALQDEGVFGFKCFTSPSGVAEFPELSWTGIEAAMVEIASFDGLLIAHAEDPRSLSEPAGGGVAQFLDSRPPEAELQAIAQVVGAARRTGCRAHIVHLSAAEGIVRLAEAQADGVRITAETCPHYLTLTAVEGASTAYKCCPPLRDPGNQDRLWAGLAAGRLACVVSDHSPCTAELKRGDFATAWGGIASLQLGLPVVWTAARDRGFALLDVVRWMAAGPADLVGLTRKGRIEVGADADFCVFAPEEAQTVDPAALHHKNAVTPYAGAKLTGAVRSSWLAGSLIDLTEPRGRFLTRGV